MTIIGETSTAEVTPPVAGLTDWYPRGVSNVVVPADIATQPFSLSTSSTGIVTVAIMAAQSWVAANQQVVLRLIQRRTDDVTYQQYQYTLTAASNTVSGKDTNGKILKFSQAAIDEGRVFVRVNGVDSIPADFASWVPNIVTFSNILPIGTAVEVTVYSQKATIARDLLFTANQDATITANSGSWGNVNWAEDNFGAKWFVYSCSTVSSLPNSAKFKVDGIYDALGTTLVSSPAVFLLASSPFENVDRYMNYNVDISLLKADFNLSTSENTFMELNADANFVREIFPPLKLIQNAVLSNSSFITADTYATSSAIVSDTSATRLSGVKIIGPV
jgi:hypothetical protein